MYQHTTRPNGAYVVFSKKIEMDELFEPTEHESEMADDEFAVIVRAVASVEIVRNGTATLYTLTGPGIYDVRIKDHRDPYLDELYAEQLDELRDDLKQFGNLQEVQS